MAVATQMVLIAALIGLLGACGTRPPCNGVACAPACPRDSSRDTSGRCACATGDAIVLGACVPLAIADAYCGPAARFGTEGCVFRDCPDDSVADAATGACLPRWTVGGVGRASCGQGKTSIVARGRTACVASDVACPRGTHRRGALCARPPRCPPGTLVSGDVCRPVVTVGVRDDIPRVDIGAWAALVLGVDGGPGTSDLCRPLSLRSDTFGVLEGSPTTIIARIAVIAPDQDLTRVHADVHGELRGAGVVAVVRSLSGEGEGLIEASVMTLIEALRGLGGEASTSMVEVHVTCTMGGTTGTPDATAAAGAPDAPDAAGAR